MSYNLVFCIIFLYLVIVCCYFIFNCLRLTSLAGKNPQRADVQLCSHSSLRGAFLRLSACGLGWKANKPNCFGSHICMVKACRCFQKKLKALKTHCMSNSTLTQFTTSWRELCRMYIAKREGALNLHSSGREKHNSRWMLYVICGVETHNNLFCSFCTSMAHLICYPPKGFFLSLTPINVFRWECVLFRCKGPGQRLLFTGQIVKPSQVNLRIVISGLYT